MDALITIGHRTLLIVLLLSAAPVLVATLVGLAIGLFQTVTQLQEQTLPFGAKMIAVVATIAMLIGWMSSTLTDFGLLALQRALAV